MTRAGRAIGRWQTPAVLIAAALLYGCNAEARLIGDVQDELRRQLPSTYTDVEFMNMQVQGGHVCGEYRVPRAGGGGYTVRRVAFWGVRSGGAVRVRQVPGATAAELCSDRAT